MFRWCALLWLLAAGSALALPPTPEIYVNGKLTMAQIGEKGRIYIDFDVRGVGGAGLRVQLFKAAQQVTETPLQEWTFSKPNGHERISLNDQPIALYRVVGIALDAQGQPVAGPSWPVPVEYGGWRAWRNSARPLNPDLRAQPPPFEGLTPGGGPPGASLELDPPNVVLRPNEKRLIKANLTALGEEDGVDWELEGEGSLEKAEGRQVIFHAPEEPGVNQISRVKATVRSRPDLKAQSVILITSMKKDQLDNK